MLLDLRFPVLRWDEAAAIDCWVKDVPPEPSFVVVSTHIHIRWRWGFVGVQMAVDVIPSSPDLLVQEIFSQPPFIIRLASSLEPARTNVHLSMAVLLDAAFIDKTVVLD